MRRQRWDELPLEPVLTAVGGGASGCEEREASSLAAFEREYRLGGRLGAGGFASVHVATHRASGLKIAVKRLEAKQMRLEDMRQEVEVLSALNHPHVVRTCGAFWRADLSEVLLLEELMAGGDLFSWIRKRRGADGKDDRSLRHDEMARLVSELLLGLQHLHNHGILGTHQSSRRERRLCSSQVAELNRRPSPGHQTGKSAHGGAWRRGGAANIRLWAVRAPTQTRERGLS